jgi:hypothetical protein
MSLPYPIKQYLPPPLKTLLSQLKTVLRDAPPLFINLRGKTIERFIIYLGIFADAPSNLQQCIKQMVVRLHSLCIQQCVILCSLRTFAPCSHAYS